MPKKLKSSNDKRPAPKGAAVPVDERKKKPKLNLRTVMKPKAAPDLGKMGRLADLTAPPKVALGPTVRGGGGLSAFLAPKKTPAQVALEACGDWYKKLVAEKPEFVAAVATMINLRRAYAVVYRELNEIVDDVRETEAAKPAGGDVPQTLVDFAVQYAMYVASKPFDEHAVMNGMIETVLPCMAEVVDKHTKVDQKEALDERATENEKRRTRPVPIGLKHSPAQDGTALTRDRALVLAGWKPAVLWLLDQVCEEVLKGDDEQSYTVLRMVHQVAKAQDQQARLVKVGGGAWIGCTNSDRDLDVMVMKFVANTVSSPIDLVVCDDVGVANTSGFVGRPRAACAGDANKRFRKWCDGMAAAFVGALPFDSQELPDFSGPEFEQLKTFSHLRPVQVLDGEDFGKADHYRLIVGTDASVFDVPKYTLDAYGSVSLIVP